MKTLLIIDAGLGQARAYMAKTLLGAAAPKAHLELIDNPNDAELAIVLGTALPADSALNGKNVYLGDINRAVAHPELFLGEAKDHAKPYVAPAAVAVPAAASGAETPLFAVTACPTGVAHTFMAAEAIETEAKKRGWWVKVETRGSVGAGNAITPRRGGRGGSGDRRCRYRGGPGEIRRQADVPHHHRSGAEENRPGAG
ncbi:PTS system fructose-specific transporter subunit IIB [Klebsiella pneumoniae subsp. rhinoscleromatis]|nr:PTS system fructose-specific transporter subunit IIB [Klebsiella pneumoniae subsp. rhinoscleromatis]